MSPALISVFLGIAIGAAASVAGAFLSYWFGLRHPTNDSRSSIGYLILTIGLLGLFSALALLGSLLNGQSVLHAVLMGIGIMLGFSAIFAALFFSWIHQDPK